MAQVSVRELWGVIMSGLESIWPSGPGRTSVSGHSMGDVWPHSALPKTPEDPSSGLVPFHKLSQWLCYSLLEPLAEAGLIVTDTEAMTGLPEYRNGGLFVDFGVLLPKYDEVLTSDHKPDAEVIIEWRALTVCLLVRHSSSLDRRPSCTSFTQSLYDDTSPVTHLPSLVPSCRMRWPSWCVSV